MDHDALKWILQSADSTGRLAHWRLRLSEFEVEVEHRTNIVHQAAKTISQLALNGKDKSTLEDDIPLLATDENTSENTSKNDYRWVTAVVPAINGDEILT